MYADMSAGRVLSRKINLIRKYNCHLILISHTGKDIPKDVRRKVVWVQKQSQKTAVLGNSVEEDDGDALVIDDAVYELENVPATTVEYESIDDRGEFEWDSASGDVRTECKVTIKSDDSRDDKTSGIQCGNDTDSGTVCSECADEYDESYLQNYRSS